MHDICHVEVLTEMLAVHIVVPAIAVWTLNKQCRPGAYPTLLQPAMLPVMGVVLAGP